MAISAFRSVQLKDSPVILRYYRDESLPKSCTEMQKFKSISSGLLYSAIAFSLVMGTKSSYSQAIDLSNQTWSAEVIRDHGQPVIPLYDGWFPNDDGSNTLCFGYFNMNRSQSLDIPRGSDNYLSDQRFPADLPTHFDPLPPQYRHVFCAFSITVPDSFDRDEKIYWHLTSNGQQLKVPGHLLPAYVLDEPRSDGRGDVAPLVYLGQESVRGRKGIHYPRMLHATAGESVPLRAAIEHAAEEVWVGWAHHSGPGEVSFNKKEYMAPSGEATEVLAIFSEPGEYIVRMQTIDDIAAFEFYCCHTNAYFHITVDEQ